MSLSVSLGEKDGHAGRRRRHSLERNEDVLADRDGLQEARCSFDPFFFLPRQTHEDPMNFEHTPGEPTRPQFPPARRSAPISAVMYGPAGGRGKGRVYNLNSASDGPRRGSRSNVNSVECGKSHVFAPLPPEKSGPDALIVAGKT